MSVPATNGEKITERLLLLAAKSELSPFEVNSIALDIRRLKGVDAAQAYMLQGMLEALTGNYAESKVQHDKSLSLRRSPASLYNYGMSMKRAGELQLARELFYKSFALNPASELCFKHIIQINALLLDYSSLEEDVSRFKRARPEFDVDGLSYVCAARDTVVQLGKLEIPIDELQKIGLHLESALQRHALSVEFVVERTSEAYSSPHLYFEISVDAKSASQLVDSNCFLLDLLMEDESLLNIEKVVVNIARTRHQKSVIDSSGSAQ